MKINKILTKIKKIPDKLNWKLKFCLVVFIVVFASIQLVTLLVSSMSGDPYLFPQSLLVKGELENEPDFKNHISSHGYIIKDLSWSTAERHGSIWIFYIKVQNVPGYDPDNIHHQGKYWSYHTNGDVLYDTETHAIVFELIDE